MTEKSLTLTCRRHNQLIRVLLLQSIPNDIGVKDLTLRFYCNDCLMEIPPSERNGTLCLTIQDINALIRKISNTPQAIPKAKKPTISENAQESHKNSKLFSGLLNFCKIGLKGVHIDENLFLKELQGLIHPFKQKVTIAQKGKVMIGDTDFPSECCCSPPDKPYIFIGNRSGELFVIHKETKAIVKKILCPNKIGAIKYIPEKKTIIVVGLGKFITKINPDNFEIISSTKFSPKSNNQSFRVIEYLKTLDLVLLGGHSVENSIELYKYEDLTRVKTINFESSSNKVDELWASKLIDSGRILVLGYRSGLLQIWNAKTLSCIHQIQTMNSVTTIEYQSDQRLIYTGHRNGEIIAWNIKKGSLYKVRSISTGTMTITKIKFLHRPFSKYLLVTNFSKTLSVWNYLGHKIDVVNVFEDLIRSIFILDNSIIISTGLTPGAIYFLQAKSLQEPKSTRKGHEKSTSPMKGIASQNMELISM